MLLRLLSGLFSTPVPASIKPATHLDPQDLALIRAFAAGDLSLRSSMTEIYYKYLPHRFDHPALGFLSELHNPVPDLNLKAQYRTELLHGSV